MFVILWTILCVVPLVFPAYMLFVYDDPGAGNFGWQMFLGFAFFWGSVLLAAALGIANGIILARKPELLKGKRTGLIYLGLNLIALVLAGAVFCCG